MTEEELQYFESWLESEVAGNAYLGRVENRLSGSELACKYVHTLLVEVKRLRSVDARLDEREECAKIAEGQPLYPDTHTWMRSAATTVQDWVKAEIARKIRERGSG